MDDKLAIALETLGADGINALYIYLTLKYVSLWVIIGLFVWAARVVWKKVKEDF